MVITRSESTKWWILKWSLWPIQTFCTAWIEGFVTQKEGVGRNVKIDIFKNGVWKSEIGGLGTQNGVFREVSEIEIVPKYILDSSATIPAQLYNNYFKGKLSKIAKHQYKSINIVLKSSFGGPRGSRVWWDPWRLDEKSKSRFSKMGSENQKSEVLGLKMMLLRSFPRWKLFPNISWTNPPPSRLSFHI